MKYLFFDSKCINYSCPGLSWVNTLEFTFTVHAQNIVAIENVIQNDDDDDDDNEDAIINDNEETMWQF